MTKQEYLASLKIGDKVTIGIVGSPLVRAHARVTETVDRTIAVSKYGRFGRKTGRGVSGQYTIIFE